MNAAIYSATSQEAFICGVDDGIDYESRDVAFLCRDNDRGLAHYKIMKLLVTVSKLIKIVMVIKDVLCAC